MKISRIRSLIGILLAGRLDYFAYTLWIRAKKLDFSPVPLAELGLSAERSVHHSASGGVYLSSVLKRLGVPPGSRILDLGSGKGAAVCTLAKFPFDEILGIDLSQKLIQIAEANVNRLGLRKIHFQCLDVGHFNDYDRFTHIYMFNPFPGSVVREVMANLGQSLARKPRALTLIYYYPFCHDEIMESGLFKEPEKLAFPCSHPWHIYVHRPIESVA